MGTHAEKPAQAIPCCPAHDVDAVLNGLPAPARLWLAPIRDQLAIAARTAEKPLGELTMPELMAWGLVGSYAVLSGIIAGRPAANIAVTVLRGPGRR